LRLVQRVVRICLATRFYIFWNKCFVYLNIENENQHTMSELTEREIKNLIKVKKDTLTLIFLNEGYFIELLGKRGVKDLIDEKLDEIIEFNKLLKKLKNNEGK